MALWAIREPSALFREVSLILKRGRGFQGHAANWGNPRDPQSRPGLFCHALSFLTAFTTPTCPPPRPAFSLAGDQSRGMCCSKSQFPRPRREGRGRESRQIPPGIDSTISLCDTPVTVFRTELWFKLPDACWVHWLTRTYTLGHVFKVIYLGITLHRTASLKNSLLNWCMRV